MLKSAAELGLLANRLETGELGLNCCLGNKEVGRIGCKGFPNRLLTCVGWFPPNKVGVGPPNKLDCCGTFGAGTPKLLAEL